MGKGSGAYMPVVINNATAHKAGGFTKIKFVITDHG